MTSKQKLEIRVGLNIEGEWKEQPLNFLVQLKKCTDTLVDDLTKSAVAEARCQGATWEEVGAALGMSRQAAWERFAPED